MKNNTESTAHGAGDGAEICLECNGQMYTVETVGGGHEKRVGCRGCSVTGRVAKRQPKNGDGLAVECPICRGYGVTSAALLDFSDGETAVAVSKCQPCGGHGNINRNAAERIQRGERFRRKRLLASLTLRECAQLLGVSAQWLSAAESGTVKNDFLGELQNLQLDLNPSPFKPRTFDDSPNLFGD